MNIDPSLLHQAAAAAAGHQQHPAGALYVVATPIGNLADLTLRAVHLLGRADAVACEDTRVTGALLAQLALRKPLVALHAHNENEAAGRILERLAANETVVLVSDAGTPAVSDPGARLVAAAAAAGYRVVPLPGASSALAALSAAGDAASEGFRFVGFLPSQGAARGKRLAALAAERDTVVLFEAPHRIDTLARELAQVMPQRPLTLARELTKQFETIATMPAVALPQWLAADANRRRGEFVLVLHAQAPALSPTPSLPAAAERALRVLLRELPLRQAVDLASEISGEPRKALYAAALASRGERDET